MIKNIFCLWTGNNHLSIMRKKNLQSIIDNSGCKVSLITPENISSINKLEYRIHDAYQYLSFTHRSDYLRAYLMYHYGGGYTDIKYINYDWNKYFDILCNSSFDFIGYPENCSEHIASDMPYIQKSYKNLCGCGHFIFKQKTDFAFKWLSKVNDILSDKLHQLRDNPGTYHPRAVFGGIFQPESDINNLYENSIYPLSWNEILGKVIHELMYNNMASYMSGMPRPNLSLYR